MGKGLVICLILIYSFPTQAVDKYARCTAEATKAYGVYDSSNFHAWQSEFNHCLREPTQEEKLPVYSHAFANEYIISESVNREQLEVLLQQRNLNGEEYDDNQKIKTTIKPSPYSGW